MSGSRPTIGVVIPVFGHSRLAAEAIVTAVDQSFMGRITIVVVIDGDPHPETQQTVRSLARAGDRPVIVVFRPNGHLSAARNTGIELLLEREANLDAVYFLDADNRLAPGSIDAFWRCLEDNPHASWAYPDVGFFGLTWGPAGIDFRVTAPEYDALRHLMGNICEAGSMVRAEVFRSGLRFDETFRSGYEDWEFWLQCLEQDMAGARAKNTGFQYRRRSDSMLADADRTSEATKARLVEKHAALYAPSSVVEKFCNSCAPFLFVGDDGKQSLVRADGKLFRNGETSLDDLLSSARHYFHFTYLPRYVVSPVGGANAPPCPTLERSLSLLTEGAPRTAFHATKDLQNTEDLDSAHYLVIPIERLDQAEDEDLKLLAQRFAALSPSERRVDQRYAGPASFNIDRFVASLVLQHDQLEVASEEVGTENPASDATLLIDPSGAWDSHPLRDLVTSELSVITSVDLRPFQPNEVEIARFSGQPFPYYNRTIEFLSPDLAPRTRMALVVSDTKTLFYIGELKQRAKAIGFLASETMNDQDFAAVVCSEHSLSKIFCTSRIATRLRSAGVPQRKLFALDHPETA